MATITPNRQGMKDLSAFNVDSQFCQQYGTQVFNYSGEITPQYQQLCANLSSVLNDITADIQAIQAQIPTTQRNA
jgi:hypothetical protein